MCFAQVWKSVEALSRPTCSELQNVLTTIGNVIGKDLIAVTAMQREKLFRTINDKFLSGACRQIMTALIT